MEHIEIAVLLQLETDPVLRWAQSPGGDVEYEGEDYTSGIVIQTGQAGDDADGGGRTVVLEVAPSTTTHAELGRDRGARPATVLWLYRLVGDDNWNEWHRVVGALSAVTWQGDRYRLEIGSRHALQSRRPVPKKWSNEAQQQRFPGDRGFEYLADLEAEGVAVTWPPERGADTGVPTPAGTPNPTAGDSRDGTVTISPADPPAGTLLTATLRDPDGYSQVRWTWERSSAGTQFAAVATNQGDTYPTDEADEDADFRARADYVDGNGVTQSVISDPVTIDAPLQDPDEN